VLDYGRILVVGSDGRWARYLFNETVGGRLPDVESFNAVAPGPGTLAMAVGDGGVFAWGHDGLQNSSRSSSGHDLNDVRYVDDDHWIMVGDDRWIQHYDTDGGWIIGSGGNGADLNAIWSRNPDDIYIVGDHGTVLTGEATTGQWADMNCPLTEDLLALDGTGGDYLFVVGRNGSMARHDGDEWEILDPPHDGDLLKIVVISWRRAYVLTDDDRLMEYVIVNP